MKNKLEVLPEQMEPITLSLSSQALYATFFPQNTIIRPCHENLFVSMASVVVVTRPLPRNGGMVEDHGAPEAGYNPKA